MSLHISKYRSYLCRLSLYVRTLPTFHAPPLHLPLNFSTSHPLILSSSLPLFLFLSSSGRLNSPIYCPKFESIYAALTPPTSSRKQTLRTATNHGLVKAFVSQSSSQAAKLEPPHNQAYRLTTDVTEYEWAVHGRDTTGRNATVLPTVLPNVLPTIQLAIHPSPSSSDYDESATAEP